MADVEARPSIAKCGLARAMVVVFCVRDGGGVAGVVARQAAVSG
jgi:hypothetical protein